MELDSEQYVSNIYDWLSPLAKEFNRKQYDTFNITARQDRLSHWVLQSKEYQEWLHSAGKTLWCLGIRTFIPSYNNLLFHTTLRSH